MSMSEFVIGFLVASAIYDTIKLSLRFWLYNLEIKKAQQLFKLATELEKEMPANKTLH